MNYINKKKDWEPKYVRHAHPPLFKSDAPNPHGRNFKSQKEEDKYWLDQEIPRWIEGYYGDHGYVPGRHYFYLQECVLRGPDGFIRPYWRDYDDYLFQAFEQAFENNNDILIPKRREWGLSSVLGGAIPAYNCLVYQSSDNLMTSADGVRVANMFEEKTKSVIQNLHPYIRLGLKTVRQDLIHFTNQDPGADEVNEKAKKAITKSAVEQKFYASDTPESATQEDLEGMIDSRIITRQTNKTPRSFETYRAIYAFLDECGLHPYADTVISSVKYSLQKNGRKNGSMAAGGTVSEMTNHGARTMYQLYKNSDTLNIDTFFIPAYANLEGYMYNGWSLEQKAKEHVLSERDRLRKAADTGVGYNMYVDYIKANPLNIEEVFEVAGERFWNSMIDDKLKERQNIVINTDPEIRKGTLQNYKENISFTPDEINGKVNILEQPLPGRFYVGGIDPIGSIGGSQGSDLGLVVLKGPYEGDSIQNAPVAIYSNRTEISKLSVDVINTLRYFNNAYTLLEQQYGEGLMKEFNQYNWVEGGRNFNAYYDLLADRVKTQGFKYSGGTNIKGQYVSGHVADRFDQLAGYFLENFVDQIYFKELLDQIRQKSKDYTPDLYSAFRLAVALFYDLQNMEKRKSNSPKKEVVVRTKERDANGVVRLKRKKMRVGKNS